MVKQFRLESTWRHSVDFKGSCEHTRSSSERIRKDFKL